eukprot:TRINITY_DN24046_c0_g1_i2.p1 TRINITY_DN24046_c0_g1~~TRINITY_DN24046_c0_g1_i2.p1  ORF type:complete len:420 (+),score=113.23 TRINITY_DN24046_c0_g1_i2:71-1330(+)
MPRRLRRAAAALSAAACAATPAAWLLPPLRSTPDQGAGAAEAAGHDMHSEFHASVQRNEAAPRGELPPAAAPAEVGAEADPPAAGAGHNSTAPAAPYDAARCAAATAWRPLSAAEEAALYPRRCGRGRRQPPQALKFLLKICRGASRLPHALAEPGCDGPLDGAALWRAVGANRTMHLSGDSIFHTQFWALVCQLGRLRGGVVSRSGIEEGVNWRWVSICVSAPPGVGAEGARVCYRDWMPWKLGLRAPVSGERALRLLRGDIVVLNVGHHLPTPGAMQQALPVLREVLKGLCGARLRLLWSETSPTAYPLPSGDEWEFQHAAADRSRWACGDNATAESLSNWKNAAVGPLLSELGVPLLPLWAASARWVPESRQLGLFRDKRFGPRTRDCVHPCVRLLPAAWNRWLARRLPTLPVYRC